ncbi:MAG: hypothetical protein HKN49_14715 [Gammaproteobacteria bacterium]|nr:hypothetical protein [Gammaproteobacteria bacterium]
MKQQRRASDYDVTGTVQVSSASAVRDVIRDMFDQLYPDGNFEPMPTVFEDFRRLFEGELPGFRGCDTVYHDMQHTLDITLAFMRLVGGYERRHPTEPLGPENCKLGLVTALFHDSGYILRDDDDRINGAEYTRTHVSRGARFMAEYFPTVGIGEMVEPATTIVHFTGYEVDPNTIDVAKPLHRVIGQLVGTADLVAQMADRCYLEKCRDRLFTEFVLGGLVESSPTENFPSGIDLLRKTPEFFDNAFNRLDGPLEGVYSYFTDWFSTGDPYTESIYQNRRYLEKVLEAGDWSILRRKPPVFTTGGQQQLEDTQEIALIRLRESVTD